MTPQRASARPASRCFTEILEIYLDLPFVAVRRGFGWP
jgi:hypothetical protein